MSDEGSSFLFYPVSVFVSARKWGAMWFWLLVQLTHCYTVQLGYFLDL